MSRLKVLFLTPTVPWPDDSGGRLRTSQLIERAGRDAEITLFSVSTPGTTTQPPAALEAACERIEVFERSRPGLLARLALSRLERSFHSSALVNAVQSELSKGTYDLVHVDELSIARALGPACSAPVLIHHHKLDARLQRDLSERRLGVSDGEVAKVQALEKKVARTYSAHATCSGDEARSLEERYGVRCSVIPNGVDAEHYTPTDSLRDEDTMLFLGTLSYEANIHGLEWFVGEVLPLLLESRPSLRLQVVGTDPSPKVQSLACDHVEVIGPVPDPLPSLQRASCSIAPLFIGGGTRIKILESLAAGCPVVSTGVGAEGLELAAGAISLASDPDAFAAAVLRLLESTDVEAMRATSDQVRALYSWEASASALLEAWESCVAKTRE